MITTQRLRADPAGLARAAEILRSGGLVAFPTETVYGLGANALDPAAIAKIFAAKARPSWDPLIVHIDSPAMLPRVADIPAASAQVVETLSRILWPGPLTLLLPRAADVPESVTSGRPLVGVRMPAHPAARDLIRLAGIPIAAPSANRFGHTSPTTADHVLTDLDGRIDAVLDGGPSGVGVESTVFDPATLTIYRPGAITADQLSRILGSPIHTATAADAPTPSDPASLPSPGMALRHYAPHARLLLVEDQAALLAEVARHPSADTGVMLPDDWSPGGAQVFRWGPWNDAQILARLLFAGLRSLDARGVKVIVCPVPTTSGLGDAIRDRLEKAAKSDS